MAKRQLRLGAFMRPVSIHTGAWRYPGAWPDANFNFAHIKRLIQKLEAGKFDAFFMADHLAVLNMPISALKRSHTVTSFEPFTLLSALAGATETYRTDRDRFDHLRRALPRRPPLRVARPHQRRPRRVEHRHHVKSGRRAEFRARRPHGARRALSPRARILRRRHGPVGFLRRRRLRARRRSGTVFRSCEDACAQSQGQISQRCAARSISPARCRAGR